MLPAQAPQNMSRIRMFFDSSGQVLKSTVENPVVVIIEATWNEAAVKASKALAQVWSMFIKIIAIDAKTIIK